MEHQINSTVIASLSIVASLLYCYFIPSNLPSSTFKLFSLLPVFLLFTIFPLSFSSVIPAAISSVFISWSANFKLLLFAFGHGPLSAAHSFLHFVSAAILPVRFDPRRAPSSSHRSPIFILTWPIKVLLLGIVIKLLDYSDRSHLNHRLVLIMYCCAAYLFVDIVFGIGNALASAVLNLELDPPSDQPYLSTSLQDFWGRRWNLMITNLLRHTVYKPVRACLDARLGEWSPPAAVLATFLVSGLMHELLYYHVTRAAPTWEVTRFFLLHGICLVVENGLKRKVGGKGELHWVVSAPLTVGFVVGTAAWLFFPPVVRTGATAKTVEECKAVLNFLTGII